MILCEQKTRILTVILFVYIAFLLPGCNSWYTNYGLQKGQLLSNEALPNLISALNDSDAKTRKSALRYISKQKEQAKDAVPDVVELIKYEVDEDVKIYAIRVLACIMPYTQENIDIMSKVLDFTTDQKMKDVANQALTRIKNKNIDADSALGGIVDLPDGITVEIIAKFSFYNGYVTRQPSRHDYMIPIEFKITNNSNHTLKMDIDSVKLIGLYKRERLKLSLRDAIQRQHYSIAKSLIGFPGVSQIKAGVANGKISGYCEKTILTNAEIFPGENQNGFLYFNCPERPKNISGWQLNFTCTQVDYQGFDIEYIFGSGFDVVNRLIESNKIDHIVEEKTLEGKILTLKRLMDKKLITEEEYVKKKKALIDNFQ